MAQKNIQKAQKTFYDDSYLKYVLYFLLALFVYVFIVNAWVGDDAYITFRTVDNFVNGYGLTWNTSERVQAYTHPLWMFIHSIFYAITGNIYYTTMFLSFAFSFLAVWFLVYKFAANKLMAIAGLILLLISKTFIDYTSSGLENPLTYFLLIVFLIFYFNKDEIQKKLFKLSLITALLMLNRMDLVLIVIPVLIYLLVKNWKAKQLLYVFYGFIPFILWEIFSIIYYGFPFPNTYYAKLNTGIPFGEYISQGLSYYVNLFNNDPMSGIVIFSGIIGIIVYSIKKKNLNLYLPLVFGIILYMLYILRIGGDFMSGRFFTGPFFIVVAILTSIHFNYRKKELKFVVPAILIALITISGFTSYHPVISGYNFGSMNGISVDINKKDKLFRSSTGIVDERGIYFSETGLIRLMSKSTTNPTLPDFEQAVETSKSKYKTIVRGMIGIFGFYSGPKMNIIDYLALAEPFLSKIKASKNPDWKGKWRIGHFYRRIPVGYIETIASGLNQIENPKLKEYYEKLKIVTQSNIFNSERLSEIWKLNTGYYDDLLVNDYKENDEPKIFSGDVQSIDIYNLRMGNYYKFKTENENALKYYKMILADTLFVNNTNIGSHLFSDIGQCYYELNNLDSSLYYANIGLDYVEFKEDIIAHLVLLSNIYIKKENISKAIEVMEEILKYEPNDIIALNNIAIYLRQTGKIEKAVEVWKKIIGLDPNKFQPWHNLYVYYYKSKNFDSAAYYAYKTVEMGGKVNSQTLEFLKKYKR